MRFLTRLAFVILLQAQRPAFESFEVATIKPAGPEPGRFIRMQSAHRFFAKNHTVKSLVAAAYNLNPKSISGGPEWIDSEHYDILAGTPGEVRPTLDEQMSMLRKLLAERFKLTFHHDQKEMSFYALTIAKSGTKVKESQGPVDALPELINVVFPDHIRLPARNATMAQFASMMQRAVLDRPVLDKTGLAAKYDFDLEWAADETQFGGQLRQAPSETPMPDLFAALQQQLGLRLEAAKGLVEGLVIDGAQRPSAN